MQTTFNSNNNLNNKPIISEITDSDILEALQVEGVEVGRATGTGQKWGEGLGALFLWCSWPSSRPWQ